MFCNAFFFVGKRTQCNKEMFCIYGGKCLLCKALHNWVEKFSQERSKFAAVAQSGHLVEIAKESTLQQMEVFI
jgi:predicted DCC family thiol-disulfide oxidoreductase YuxK